MSIEIESIYPLSPMQQGMLFHSLYAPESGVYFEQITLGLKGKLNIFAFESAWQKVVDRYPILRTFFIWENRPVPLQVVLNQVTLPWNNLDWSSLSPKEQQQQLSELLQKERKQGFVLNQAPLMRGMLIKLSDETYEFIWSFHHILIDGWSLSIIFKEVLSFYYAQTTGKICRLPAPVSYQDYITWLNSQNTEAALEFWQETLQDFSAPTPLGVDKTKSPDFQTDSHYSELKLRLGVEVSRGLQNIANQNHLTLSTIVQGVWALLLSRYSGEENVVFGVTVSGRTADLSGIEKMVGLLINTLPLLVKISPSEKIISWLEEIQQSMSKIQDYSYTPLLDIQAHSEIPGGMPLFESIVVFENYPFEKTELNEEGSLQLSEMEGVEQTNYPLTILVGMPEDELLVKISYDTLRFEADTIERMLGHLQTIFSAIVANPQQTLSELPLLTEAERYQLLIEWNNTYSEYPQDVCIHQLFEQQVELTPDAIAVVFEEQQLTYLQLNQKANQLAHYLQSLGIGPEVLVGICVERSVEMAVGLLGILKAGGAYVPLDPNYPVERLNYMLEDSGVEVLLTQKELLSSLPSSSIIRVVCLDRDWRMIEEQNQLNLETGVGSDNLAYLIYTSGSTGQPKGVAMNHRPLVNLILWQLKKSCAKCGTKTGQFTSISFDVSFQEILSTWCSGGTLVIITEDVRRDGTALLEMLAQQEVGRLFLPFVALEQLAQSVSNSQLLPENLQELITAGEQLKITPALTDFLNKLPNCRLENQYGPTESHVVTAFPLQADANISSSLPPIGRPIANTQIYILDKYLQPVPIGVAGEIYIGGDALARGYLNRPELTTEKFIPNSFNPSQSPCLYRTGDLARYLSDGNIEYLGRIDNQTKIRGFRIELGEIEAVINSHPQVQQATVIVREDISDYKRLVAYVVTQDDSVHSNQLREDLKQKLPEYMVPSAFVFLESLPLTPNGKINRKALPAPDKARYLADEYIAPSTEVEVILSNIWQELLLKETVGIHDNFFNLGGDSILSIQVVSRAKNLGIQITPKQIFQNQTIAKLARVVNTTVGVNAQQGRVIGTAPLTPIQQWFFSKNRPEAHHYNQSVLLRLPQSLSNELIALALKKLVEHHDALCLRFTSQAAEYPQINSKEDEIPLILIDLSSTPVSEQAKALEKIATEYQASLNLSTGPIIRAVMFNFGQDEKRLLIVVHHLAVDGVSWRILIPDLATIYQQIEAKQPIKLSPKTTAFKDWAVKLKEYAQSEIIKQELDYWLNQPWSQSQPIPTDYDYTQSANTAATFQRISNKLSIEDTSTLLGSINGAYNTQINDILLSALVKVLGEWTAKATILIDLEGHGREDLFEDIDLSRTVGWFTSLFPILLQIPEIKQPEEVIKSIKEQLRAIPKRGIGYGILKYLCEEPVIQEKIQKIPNPEISFNYLGQFDQIQAEKGWSFATESTGREQSTKQNRDHLLEINGLVMEGQLQINWHYSSAVHSRATVEHLAQNYLKEIATLIEHCQSEKSFGYTPSDFPDVQLNQEKIDELLVLLGNPKIESIYPLSPMQQGMLFHSIYAPHSGVYFQQTALKLQGDVNETALREAWQKVVDRYSVLRTLFVWENCPIPLQVVLKQVTLPWSNLDWSSLSPKEQQQQLSELLQREREQGFDFNQPPLIHCTLIKLSDETYKFIWSFHHILIDGWSLPIIFKEAFSFYQAEQTGETCCLPTAVPYRDYIAWLNSQNTEAAFEFWQETLRGFSAPTSLRIDKIKSPHQSPQQTAYSNYSELELRLGVEVSRELQNVANQNYLTLSTIVQGVWALLLSRYSGEENVVFGVTVSGRTANLSGIEKMVGLSINTLPLLVQISPSEKLIPWLAQIQQSMSKIQDYCYTPLFEIQACSEVTGGMPLFESIVVFENYPVDKAGFNEESSLHLSEIEGLGQTNYPLTLVAIPGDELSIRISYDNLRFEKDTMERMLGHLQTIFSAIAQKPQQNLAKLPLLSEPERHQLLVEWNNTESEYLKDKCIHQLFEKQVELTPDAVALVFEEQQLTYRQLNTKVNQLAHYLQSLGVKPEILVGICAERSLEMVIGLLGILKAGGAYVPLDPNYPEERLSYMLNDSGVEVLLTQEELLSSLPPSTIQTICLDRDWGMIEKQDRKNPDTGVGSENLAYVIYTSGSTGQPKGVLVEHYALVNHCQNIQSVYHLIPSDRVLQFASPSFDPFIEQTILPLTVGAGVVVRNEELWEASEFQEQIDKYGITVINLPPAYWQQLIWQWGNCTQLAAKDNLRLVIIGGDTMPPEALKFWQKTSLASTRLLNAYGPTEATITSTIFEVSSLASFQEFPDNIPIGRPIVNIQTYILDRYLQPVPIGIPGELYIGGNGLARGYLNLPELTNEKFIPNPFNPAQSLRLYRTGDQARYLADGNIEFLGRIDNQVKIRGFRIELGEIEAVLNSYPQVQQAVVIVREDIADNKRLVAYVVTEDDSINSNQLREGLKQKLPEYMVPSAFVFLETLPLTLNGKIDRNILPAPEGEITRTDLYVAPRTQSEEIIANIFATILGTAVVGIDDNFFNLGGHSLLATQLISRLREIFQIEIPLRTVFESPTVAQLDQAITELRTLGSGGSGGDGLNLPSLAAIKAIAKEVEVVPLSFAQERLWFLDQLEESSAIYNIPAAIRLTGNLQLSALEQALREIVRRHEILRTSFPTVNGKPRQIINPEITLNIKVIDLQHLETTEPETEPEKFLEQEVSKEASIPFDLEVAPLIRCSLLQISAREYVLLLTMHHIVSDGWSMGIFVQELSSLYQAFSAGEASPLAELPIQYGDFALWQREWLSGEILETQLNYWKQQLQNAPELLQLPTDRTRPTVQTFKGKTQRFRLNQDLTQKLHKLSRESNVTLFMTLLATFATILYRYSGQTDILIGSPIANRHYQEIESLIGFFINTLVYRTSFEDNPSFLKLLNQVRETTLKAYEHQDVPFEQVVEALQPERSLSHSPIFQVMFVLQNAPMGELELPGLALSHLEQDFPIAKFDLTLSISETSQGLEGGWEYNTDLFDSSTIERMAAHFENLLSAIVAHPQIFVNKLPLLTEAERHQLLVKWNNTESEYPKDKCIHQLFEQQVELTPNAVAVIFEEEQLTYEELNQKANQLAHYLQNLGVEPGVLVGICVERSVEMVVGLLGILKAGGAYVPLDPTYPAERLSYMLDDSGVEVLLTQEELLSSLASSTAKMVCLNKDWGMIKQESPENLDTGISSDNLAYVIYTSGSTGQPKGVMIPHQGLLNLVFWHQATFGITSSDIATQLAGTAFDAAAWELWPYLSAGASIHLVKTEILVQPQILQNWLIRNKVTITFIPTPLLESFLSLEWSSSIALRIVLTGGDKLHQYPSTSLPFKLINNYGPTENTVVTTSGLINITEQANLLPPIGRPIANTQIYILDKYLQPVPIGVLGEIYIGGDSLARGYLNRPELTRERFISNPFGMGSLYITGDQARYLPDGNIEFLGRIDNQVKIRGFRIELGEIEAVLNSHLQVQQAIAIVKEDISDNKRLVAYVVTQDDLLNTSQLKEDIEQKLPKYMMPSGFVFLETLPLTPNGKINYKALPAPEGEITRTDKYIAPSTEIEVILSNIWQELLLKEKVGIHDNFFNLGGDSILSIQVVSTAKNLGIQITPKQIFLNQTIAELARVANTTVGVNAQQGIVTGTAPLTPIQQRFFAQNHIEPHHYNQSCLLSLPQNLSNESLALALKKLVEHHDALRLRFTQQTAEYPPIDFEKEESVPLSWVDLSSIPPTEKAKALEKIATEYQASLNLSTEPIMRVVLFKLGENDSRLLIIIHHLAVDGVSWRILISDLVTIYQQIEAQQPIKLNTKTTAFKDWAVKLNKYAQSEIIKQELDYWLNQPWSQNQPLPIDYDYTQSDNIVTSTQQVLGKLSIEDTSNLLGSVNGAYNTQINDLLLSALVKVLAEWTGNSTILIDLEGHGREDLFEDVDLSRTVGWFTSLFPVLLKMPIKEQPGEVIKSIKEQLRSIPNRGMGYGMLRYLCEETTIQEQIQRIPSPEISFNYLGQFDQIQAENGWLFATESTGANQSKRQNREHILDISALVIEGKLQISWSYSSQVHNRSTVENLAHNYTQAIVTLIEHCQSDEAFGYTPSDFPDVELNQKELNTLLEELEDII
jgi:amino acid adenylation domain-containing protein/non-ribosomal peptide synthase protein (TIGR01720 family)